VDDHRTVVVETELLIQFSVVPGAGYGSLSGKQNDKNNCLGNQNNASGYEADQQTGFDFFG